MAAAIAIMATIFRTLPKAVSCYARAMIKMSLFAAALAASTAAAAEPVNLVCPLPSPTKQRTLEITLNEAEGTASWQWDGSEPLKNTAIFTATKVKMRTITIDRTTLEIEQANPDFLVKESGYPPVSRGQCQLRKVTRAF